MTSSYLSQARSGAINIRDLLGIRNINSANPSTVGKIIYFILKVESSKCRGR